MRKRDLVDGLVGPRTREMMDQLLCMNGMTNAEKVDFLMSRNRELRAENEKLRELVKSAWKCVHTGISCFDCRLIAGGCTLQSAMRELGVEVGE